MLANLGLVNPQPFGCFAGLTRPREPRERIDFGRVGKRHDRRERE